MNSPDPEIERLLSRVSPAAPDDELMARLRAARPAEPKKPVFLHRWLALAAAACIALAWLFFPSRPAVTQLAKTDVPPAAMPDRKPLESREHLMEVTDFGIVQDRLDRPVRLIGTTWLDETDYAAGPDGKRVTESRVRQEILPVSIQTY